MELFKKKDTIEKLNSEVVTDALADEQINETAKYKLNLYEREFNLEHKLDKNDWYICIAAGLISTVIDVCLVGIPVKTIEGLKAGPLSNEIRKIFEMKFKEFEASKYVEKFKVCYDAANNSNTSEFVEGLSAYYHRLLSLGHDPILGLFFGVRDIMNGTFTSIDKLGNIIIQPAPNKNTIKKGIQVIDAVKMVLGHFKTDVTTSMGLPAPFMALFNFCQFGSIGEYDQTIAEVVQGMYYEGYDVIHFTASTVPVLINEIIVRFCYLSKNLREGKGIKKSAPISNNRIKHPKLQTMLFIAHTISCGGNALKVKFVKNPMALNLAQWYAYLPYVISQIKWVAFEKVNIRNKMIGKKIDEAIKELDKKIDRDFEKYNSYNM